ncbi:MAG: hypothetical protein NDI75_15190 [Candidatus Didemnitutus sp.]|nr:hypothetical protein [Candidatus Didemnitutus sp.]
MSNTVSKTVDLGFKRRARLFGASTAWSLGGWLFLLALGLLWLRLS